MGLFNRQNCLENMTVFTAMSTPQEKSISDIEVVLDDVAVFLFPPSGLDLSKFRLVHKALSPDFMEFCKSYL